MELVEIYNLAKTFPDFNEFEQYIKAKMTGEPITQEINCELMLIKVNYSTIKNGSK